MYGYSKYRSFKKFTPGRTTGVFNNRSIYRVQKVGNTYKKGSVKASYAKDEEKKYNDRAIGAGFTQYGFGNANSGGTTNAITSVGFKTDSWYGFNFNQPLAAGVAITQDLVKGLETGTTSITRVGNKVKCKYIKGSILLTANQENSSADSQNGEKVIDGLATGKQYLRTSWRIVIVKDTQSNSTDANITWDQVFTHGVVKTNEEVGGINSELNIGNMGRFIILSDQCVELSAESPQKTIKFMLPGSKIGSVRYNGPSGNALTDKGVYVIAANQSTGMTITGGYALPGLCAVQSRFCFVDE